MHTRAYAHHPIFGVDWNPGHIALTILLMLMFRIVLFLFLTLTAQPAQGQTYSVLYDFTNGSDGANPFPSVTIDANGNLYGTTSSGGAGYGTAFKMSVRNSTWILTPLHIFQGGSDGSWPTGGVIIDASGALYGTTTRGGREQWGTVFKLTPPASAIGQWTEQVLYNFTDGSDGGNPFAGVVFDNSGNLYGTAYFGGYHCSDFGCGTVFQLMPSEGEWTETVLHTFMGGSDGASPFAGVVFDGAGNLYGTASGNGPYSCGLVFQLTPSSSAWTYNILYSFTGRGDGCQPAGNVIFDQAGNLYGTTPYGGFWWHGTVFELSPFNGNWNFNLLLRFSGTNLVGPGGPSDCMFANPRGPTSGLTLDSAGNLYGTTQGDGNHGWGNVFKLTPSMGGWTYRSLYDFTGGVDGGSPCGGVTLNANRNLYGTAIRGGAHGYGVVWEITP